MRIKYLDARERPELEEYTYRVKRNKEMIEGYISVISIHEVKKPLVVSRGNQQVCIADAGYKNVIFLPDKEEWCVTAIYDRDNKIVQWYFDVVREKGIDERGIPFFEDMYLDVVVSDEFKIYILDEDELEDALASNDITKIEYDRAYRTRDRIVKRIIRDTEFMEEVLRNQLEV